MKPTVITTGPACRRCEDIGCIFMRQRNLFHVRTFVAVVKAYPLSVCIKTAHQAVLFPNSH
jgi:hypothetical protein